MPPFSMPRNDKNLVFRWMEHVAVKSDEKIKGKCSICHTSGSMKQKLCIEDWIMLK